MTKLSNVVPRWMIWGLVLPLLVLNGWVLLILLRYFRPVVNVFTVAALLSFILDYPTVLLQKRGMKRSSAALLVFLTGLLAIAMAGIILVPILVQQLTELASFLPSWIDAASQQVQIVQQWADVRNVPINFAGLGSWFANLLPEEFETLPDEVLGFILSAVDSILEVILTAVLSLYLLLNGDSFWKGITQWFPDGLGEQMQQALREKFENYFIGQATVAGLEAIALTIVFFFLKVPFFLLFGIGIGVTVLIPLGDILGIALVSLLVSLKSFMLGLEVLAIAVVVDQVIDQGIAPRIIGELIGLNPVWTLLSLLIGAQIGGALGVLIAVPIASSIKSIIDYLRSPHTPSVPTPAMLEPEPQTTLVKP